VNKFSSSILVVIFALIVMATVRLQPSASKVDPQKAAATSEWDMSEADRVNSGGDTNDGHSGAVVLERAPDGHFYADADVNGTIVHFMVDTGATSVALSPQDAAAIGIDQNAEGFTETGRGVGGNVAMMPVMLDKLSIGSLVSRDVPAVVVQTNMEVSLLGQTWLSRVASVNIEGNRMTLR
jgi:aspartyl protease family protein